VNTVETQATLVQPVVLSGGSGTRLWPLSREKYPKQLLPLIGEDSLLQATVRRAQGMAGVQLAEPMVVSNEEYRFVIAEQLREMGSPGRIVLEPTGRNTAPALTLAALAAAQTAGTADPVLLVMPADHVMLDTGAFQEAVRQGAALAGQGAVVTFGITPDAPETGYGYIQSGDQHGPSAYRIARFVEKPDAATAQRYLDAGTYWWNSGIFMVRASVWLAAIQACRPDILAACQKAWQPSRIDGDFVRVDKDAFGSCPSDSIDYAVMERLASNTGQAAAALPLGVMIPLQAGWSDVGSWDALWQVLPKDDAGNVALGDVLLQDCSNTLALSEGRLVACVGVEDLIVVETADAILVVHKDKTQDVKKVVDRLKGQDRPEGKIHRKVFRPWGWYDGVDAGSRFQVKRIVVKPQGILSLQMHHHRAEHWIVVSGTARVTRGDESFLVSENQSTFIPLGTTHRLENPGRVPLEMIEVQSGSYLGEDDIVRFEDVYGR
jgi:mannose-1-phosphate guanylyltransferase/mannose-6-phosphate isomerase